MLALIQTIWTLKSDSSKDLNRIGQLLIVWKIFIKVITGESTIAELQWGESGEKLYLYYLYDLCKSINCAKSLVKNSSS